MGSNSVVHIVDDDESVRSSLSRLLDLHGYQTQCYASAGAFLMTQRPSGPGCILLDIRMPGPSGLELYDMLAKQPDSLPVVFLTGVGDIETGVGAIKSGAVDFLTKPVQTDQLMLAIGSALMRGERQRELQERNRLLRQRYEKLTARERDVLLKVTDGRLNKQIAAELGTSERTVKAHRAQVMEKMGARSLPDLVRAFDQLSTKAA